MPYIQRDSGGRIVQVWGEYPQTGIAEEWIDQVPEGVSPVISVVSRYRAFAAMLQAGVLGQVRTWAADPATDPLHQLAFETATEFRSDSPALIAGAQALGWTSVDLKNLFLIAETIQI